MNVAGFGWRTLRSSLTLSSVVGTIGRAGLRKNVGLIRPGPRGPKVLWHQMVVMCRCHEVPEIVTTDTGQI